MKRIFVRKIFCYDPTFGGEYSKYDGYDLITTQKKQPDIVKNDIKVDKLSFCHPIYCSTLLRGENSALLYGDKILQLKELDEVKFSLKKLLTREEYNLHGSSLVRERFIEAFIKNTLQTKREDIKRDIENLFIYFNQLTDGNYLVVSHSFKIKLIEVYLKNRDIFEKPYLLRNYFNTYKKTYNFGEGFNINI